MRKMEKKGFRPIAINAVTALAKRSSLTRAGLIAAAYPQYRRAA